MREENYLNQGMQQKIQRYRTTLLTMDSISFGLVYKMHMFHLKEHGCMLAMEILLFGLIGILDNLTVPILKKIVVKLDLEITLVTSGMMLVVNGSLVLFVREKELPPHLTLPHNIHLQKEVTKLTFANTYNKSDFSYFFTNRTQKSATLVIFP